MCFALNLRTTAVYNPRKQSSCGQHEAHLGPVGPRWASCWPHGPCYQGLFQKQFGQHNGSKWSNQGTKQHILQNVYVVHTEPESSLSLVVFRRSDYCPKRYNKTTNYPLKQYNEDEGYWIILPTVSIQLLMWGIITRDPLWRILHWLRLYCLFAIVHNTSMNWLKRADIFWTK